MLDTWVSSLERSRVKQWFCGSSGRVIPRCPSHRWGKAGKSCLLNDQQSLFDWNVNHILYSWSCYLIILHLYMCAYDELFSTLIKMIIPGSEARRSLSSHASSSMTQALMDWFPVPAGIQVTCSIYVSHTHFIDSDWESKDLPVVSDVFTLTLTRGLDTQR